MKSTDCISFEGQLWKLAHAGEIEGGDASDSLLLVSGDPETGEPQIILAITREGVRRLDAPPGFETEEGPDFAGGAPAVDGGEGLMLKTRLPDISEQPDSKPASN